MAIILTVKLLKGRELPPGLRYTLEQGTFTIGRSKNDDFILHDPELLVSRGHAAVYSAGDRYFLQNQKKNNFTLVNGRCLQNEERVELTNGALVEIGDYHINVAIGPVDDPPPVSPKDPGHPAAARAGALPSQEEDDWWLQYLGGPPRGVITGAPTTRSGETSARQAGEATERPRDAPCTEGEKARPGRSKPRQHQGDAQEGDEGDAFRQFLRGLGLPQKDVEILAQNADPRMMHEFGQVLRT
jgi:predicted component of type VI protein secretion system